MITTAYFGPQSSPEQNRIVGDFVSTLIWGEAGQIRDYCTMAVMDGGELIAGVAYYDWDKSSGVIQFSAGSLSKRWLTRPVLKAMFELPFIVLGCQMCVVRVSERNDGMIHICRSFGFDEHFVPRLAGRDEGQFLFTYTDDQWAKSPFNRDSV